jgi:hypothetical protein
MLVYVLAVAGIAGVVGLLIRRWWFVLAVAFLALSHAAWILLAGKSTTEDSPATLVALAAIFFYAPALAGAVVGTLLGRSRAA